MEHGADYHFISFSFFYPYLLMHEGQPRIDPGDVSIVPISACMTHSDGILVLVGKT